MAAHSAGKEKGKRRYALAVLVALGGLVCIAFLILHSMSLRQGEVSLHAPTQHPLEQSVKTLPTASSEEYQGAGWTEPPTPIAAPAGKTTALLRVVGDLMVHERQYLSCQTGEDTYDFTPCFASIASLLQQADLAIGNLETTISHGEYSGFPSFRSPVAYLDALKDAGFDVLTFANNHTYDARANGIETTLSAMEERGLLSTGAYAQQEEDAKRVLVVDVQGISVGILAYADMGFSAPKWQINTLDDMKSVARDVEITRGLGADIVLAMVHWGSEYAPEESSRQQKQAKQLAEMGIDLILGAHPHVVQRSEWIETTAPDGGVKRSYVLYSLGNFLSNQRPTDNNGRAPVDGGLMLDIMLEKDLSTGETRITAIQPMPTLVLRRSVGGGMFSYDVIPIDYALEEESGLGEALQLTASERRRMRAILERIHTLCPGWMDAL